MTRPPKWTEQKIRMVHAMLQGEGSIAAIARQNKVSETSLGKWRDAFLDGGAAALRTGGRPARQVGRSSSKPSSTN